MAVSDGKKKCRKLPVEVNLLGADSIGPKPPALFSIQKSRMSDINSMKGAEKLCRKRIDSTPHHTTTMFSNQKQRKHVHSTQGMWMVCGRSTPTIAAMACPPSHDWMPNHPHATNGRKGAG